MDKEVIRYKIKSALIPNYYRNFHCIMGDCQDNCCDDGWKIEFNKKDYLAVKRAAEKSESLREAVSCGMRRLKARAHDQFYAEFCISNQGRCAFHTEEGLCRLQVECGADVLPEICRIYPRRIVYTSAAKEYSLTPSCEGVLQQLWDLPQGVEFVEDPLPKSEQRSARIEMGEHLQLYFTPLRALCIDILQDRSMPLDVRMLCLGIVIEQLKKEDWKTFDVNAWIERVTSLVESGAFSDIAITGNRGMYLMHNLNILNKLSKSKRSNDWINTIYKATGVTSRLVEIHQATKNKPETIDVNTSFSREDYMVALNEFDTVFSDYSYFFENLMVAIAMFIRFPNLNNRDELWKSYTLLCNLYSFYRFVSVSGCKGTATKEQLFRMIVMASRATLHNQDFEGYCKELFDNGSSTLAHMAILIKG